MTSFDDLAAKFYGGGAEKPEVQPATQAAAQPAVPEKATEAAPEAAPADPASAFYPSDPFAAADKLGFNDQQPMPESPSQLSIDLPEGWSQTGSDEDVGAFKEGIFAAGINQDLFNTLSTDFYHHAANPVTTTADDCMSELRREWGGQTDAKMKMAKAMVDRVAVKWPGVWDLLEQHGTGNDPKFIRKLVARAEHLSKSGKF